MSISYRNTATTFGSPGKSREEEVKIAGYLEQIAEEAAGLLAVWEKVAQSILDTGVADASTDRVWIRLVERPEWTIYSRSIPKSRLELFFERMASVLGKNQKANADTLFCRIGAILQKRKLTREMLEEEFRRMKEVKFFDKQNQVKGEISIAQSVSLLKTEVMALSTFAKEYRTKI